MQSDILNKFNGRREEFRPYGLTCEMWTPCLMPKSDRHNEIEINYFPFGEMTYLFHDCKITIPSKTLSLFWGLVPHQIVCYEGDQPYYVCTIPFTQFLDWKLPALFVDKILKGRVLMEDSEVFSEHDEFLLKNWIEDIRYPKSTELILLEMQARLMRMANNLYQERENVFIEDHETSLVENMAIYIARNYSNSLKMSDIGKAVGLHPDYANSIFKKAFGATLSEYVLEERIAHAQRKLLASNMSITEVAFDCGFNSTSRFNAAFLKMNGCTPREFKKKNQ